MYPGMTIRKTSVTVTTYADSGYVDGRYQEAVTETKVIQAVVMRCSMKEKQLMPEGYRGRETLKLYFSPEAFREIEMGDTTRTSTFTINGKIYEQLATEHWDQLIEHTKVQVVRQEGDVIE